jgi:hypothetical protein
MDSDQKVEIIIDPYVVGTGDLIEHKSYPGKRFYVTVTGKSIYLFESKIDQTNEKVFATAGNVFCKVVGICYCCQSWNYETV